MLERHRELAKTTARIRRVSAALALALVSCMPVPPDRTPPAPKPEPAPARAPSAAPASRPNAPPEGGETKELSFRVRAPSAVRYNAELLGPPPVFVAVEVTNDSSRAVAVGGLRVAFRVARDGVEFPCREHVSGSLHAHEPSVLAPSATFVYERDLDCVMSLPGRYDVRAFARFTPDADVDRGTGPARGELAGELTLDVRDAARAPRAVPARDGLYALMTGSPLTEPMAPEAWARGDYHVVVALINGGPHALSIGPARLAFLVYRQGSPLPCSGESERLAVPGELGPGVTHVTRAAVTCAPSDEGDYQLVGKLALGEPPADPVEIGRVDLRVTREPLVLPPSPIGYGVLERDRMTR